MRNMSNSNMINFKRKISDCKRDNNHKMRESAYSRKVSQLSKSDT